MALFIQRDRRAIIIWLALCALLVAAMVLIGGYTRLSGSGLSITSWKPIHGVVPPLDMIQWQEEFSAYQASPQYRKINSGMSLEEFKTIFWPEFIHRLLARIIGVVFFLPLIIFAMRRSFSTRFGWRLAIIFALGGLQGLIGWLMVKSGLIDQPYVSPLRLALHLWMALIIFALILWALLDVSEKKTSYSSPATGDWRLVTYILWFIALCKQISLGAFMAGLHAGLIYNTWPSMNGQFVPDGIFFLEPWYLNFLENVAMIQFLHRGVAILVAGGFLLWWYFYRQYVKNAHLGKVCSWVTAIIAAQFALGVVTLLYQAPLPLALAHQMMALLLFAASVMLLHRLSKNGYA